MASRSAESLGPLLLAQGTKLVCSLVSVVVLSRLLSPKEFGYASVCIAVVGVGEVFRDMGLSTAVVREVNEVGSVIRSTLFWMNFSIGVGLFMLVLLTNGLQTDLFGPEVASLLPLLATVFVLNGSSAQYRAHLNREMRFRVIASSDAISTVLGLVVALVLAIRGVGAASVIWQNVAVAASFLVIVSWKSKWIPGLSISIRRAGAFIRFGFDVFISQIWSYLGSNVDTILLGHYHPGAEVGIYNRGFQLVMSPLNQLRGPANTYAIPVISRRLSSAGSVLDFVLKAQIIIGYTVLPISGFVLSAHDQLVRVALGPDWEEVGPVVAILVCAGALQQLSASAGWLLTAAGRGRDLRRYSLVSLVVKVAAIAVGVRFGSIGVASAYLVAVVFLWPVSLWWSISRIGESAGRVMWPGIRMVALPVCGGLVGWVLNNRLALGSVSGLGVGFVTLLCTYGLACIASRTVRIEVSYSLAFLRSVLEAIGRRRAE